MADEGSRWIVEALGDGSFRVSAANEPARRYEETHPTPPGWFLEIIEAKREENAAWN